jgi:hypothetical protein
MSHVFSVNKTQYAGIPLTLMDRGPRGYGFIEFSCLKDGWNLASGVQWSLYTMQQQAIIKNTGARGRQYASVSQSLQQQNKLLKTQQEIERRQRLLAQGIAKGENMLKKVQQQTLASIQRGAESKALLEMANKLGLPLNQKTLKGYILAEIQAALLQTTGKTSS